MRGAGLRGSGGCGWASGGGERVQRIGAAIFYVGRFELVGVVGVPFYSLYF